MENDHAEDCLSWVWSHQPLMASLLKSSVSLIALGIWREAFLSWVWSQQPFMESLLKSAVSLITLRFEWGDTVKIPHWCYKSFRHFEQIPLCFQGGR